MIGNKRGFMGLWLVIITVLFCIVAIVLFFYGQYKAQSYILNPGFVLKLDNYKIIFEIKEEKMLFESFCVNGNFAEKDFCHKLRDRNDFLVWNYKIGGKVINETFFEGYDAWMFFCEQTYDFTFNGDIMDVTRKSQLKYFDLRADDPNDEKIKFAMELEYFIPAKSYSFDKTNCASP